MAGFGICGVGQWGSATTVLVRQVVRMGRGWNWLRIVSNGRLWD